MKIASMETFWVEDYLCRVWHDGDSGDWMGVCETVHCVAQDNTRDGALEAMQVLVPAMLQELDAEEHTRPAPDWKPDFDNNFVDGRHSDAFFIRTHAVDGKEPS